MNPKATSIKPSTTFTEFNQPPDFGRLLSFEGKKAKKPKGKATAIENPNIPIIGRSTDPLAASTSTVPTIGAVQEKDTNTKVKAMKKAPTYPPLSACASDLFTIQEGNTISKAPKKEAAKIIKITKKNTLGTQLVLNQLIKSGPNNIEIINPRAV